MRGPPPTPEGAEIAVWRFVPSAKPTWQPGILRHDHDLGGWGWEDGAGPGDVSKDTPKALWTPPVLDAHTHLGDAFLRPERQRLPRTLRELVAPPGGYKHQRLRDTPPMTIRAHVHERAARMTQQGTAHVLDFREGGAEGLKVLFTALEGTKLRASAYGRPTAPPTDRARWLRELEALVHDTPMTGVGLSGLADLPQGLADAASDVAWAARKPVALHLSEPRHEDMHAALALEPSLLVHLVHATRSDLDDMAHENVLAVTCPSSNRFFGARPPLDRLLDASMEGGLAVALGTDNAMLGDGDIRDEMRIVADAVPDATIDWLMRAATWTPWRHLALGPDAKEPGLLWGLDRKVPALDPMEAPLSLVAPLLQHGPYAAPVV